MKQRVALAFSLLALTVLFGCGSSGSTSSTPSGSQQLSKNWQFTMADQTDSQGNDFTGGVTGGFLQQKGNALTGSFAYGIHPVPTQPNSPPCAGGSAAVSGTLSGQNVTLTVSAGIQTYTLTGSLSADGTTMMGNYTTTAGVSLPGGGICGVAQTGAQWSAVAIPAFTGSFQGNIHAGPIYTITGTLLQGPNTGASSATVTGDLFSDDDPCFTHASLNGTISGSSVLLNVIGDSGLVIGHVGSSGSGGTVLTPAVFGTGSSGDLTLRGSDDSGLTLTTTSKCSAGGGNICLGTAAASCAQPFSFSLSSVAFPSQLVGTSRTQTVTLTNTDPMGATQSGTFAFGAVQSDFSPPAPAPPLYNFTEQDNCVTPPLQVNSGGTVSLAAGKSCTINVTYSPVQSCTRNPIQDSNNPSSVPPLQCPSATPPASITVFDTGSPDGNPTFAVNFAGSAQSAIVPSEAQLGFSAVTAGQTGPSQTVSLINSGTSVVQILGPATSGAICVPPFSGARMPGVVPGLQVVGSAFDGQFPITYLCDMDPTTELPNFPITNDHCTNTLLAAGKSCTFDIAFSPQPDLGSGTDNDPGRDFFVQLSTLQCSTPPAAGSPCEIDSGRLPIDLKWNVQSPLRITPYTGFDFGTQAIGSDTVQTFTLLNSALTPVNFLSISTTSTSRFSQTNTCGTTLAPGSTCTIDVDFHPLKTSLTQDIVVIQPLDAASGVTQQIYVWGRGQ